MQKIKNMMIFQKVSFALSIIAFVLSIISIISINKINNDIVNIATSEGKGFNLIGKVPDVEIIRPDGSIDKIKANESADKLNDIIENKIDKKSDLKKDKELKKIPVPFKKEEKIKEKQVKVDSKNKVVSNDNVSKNEKKAEKKNNEIVYAIQFGAFNKQEFADKQCQDLKKYILAGKKCKVIPEKNMFKSVVGGFKDKKEANEFLKNNNLKGMIKVFKDNAVSK